MFEQAAESCKVSDLAAEVLANPQKDLCAYSVGCTWNWSSSKWVVFFAHEAGNFLQ